jgi:integrase
MTELIPSNYFDQSFSLIPDNANKDQASRLRAFQDWLKENHFSWHTEPDLAAYRDHLLERLKPSSVNAHLGTIRSRINKILKNNQFRDSLEIGIREALELADQVYRPADIEALINRKITRLKNAIDPDNSSVDKPKIQDIPDSAQRRLTHDQANALIAAPGLDTLRGLRDTAIIALMLTTGIRAAEAAAVEVCDLRKKYGGELALHVRHGKGDKSRLIVYGGMDWVLIVIEAWLDQAGIQEGPVFRGFYRGSKTIRSQGLTTRAVEMILARYPIPIDGKMETVAPHDLRRTYAKLNYLAGMDPISLKQNLGHESLDTTTGYIGTLDASARRPPAVLTLNLNGIIKER